MTYKPVPKPDDSAQLQRWTQSPGGATAGGCPPSTGGGAVDANYGSVKLVLHGALSAPVSIPDSADWDFGTADFTAEVIVNFTAHTSVMSLIGDYQNSTTGWIMQRRSDTNTLRFGYGDTAIADPSWTPTDGTDYHLAVCRIGTSLRLFVNGTQLGSTVTNSTNITGSSNPLLVGALNSAGSIIQTFSGVIKGARITKGVGRYNASFAPPTHFPTST